jgi:hypothetical protein
VGAHRRREHHGAEGELVPVTINRSAVLVVLLAAACSTGPATVGARFKSPTDVVSYAGVTAKVPGVVRDYLAVPSSRGDAVQIIDPLDNQPILGPGLVFPLALSTAPYPFLVASVSLDDPAAVAAGTAQRQADVLVVVSAGGAGFLPPPGAGVPPVLQVIETWTTQTRIAFEVSLHDALGDAEILSVAGVRPAGAPANSGWIVVGATGGKLAVVEFGRDPAGSGGVVATRVTAQTLGFDPLDLAPDTSVPGRTLLYVATRDPITTAGGRSVFGVAEVDASAGVGSVWTVRALAVAPPVPLGHPATAPASVPTTVVAAAAVDERRVNSANGCSADQFVGTPKRYVYAALDPAACGPNEIIACGIVTLDPATGQLATDPAAGAAATDVPAQAYRAPMPVPGFVTHIAIAKAPAQGQQRLPRPDASGVLQFTDPNVPTQTCPTTAAGSAADPNVSPLIPIAPGTGQRYSSALAAVSSSDGHAYWLDLSRWGPTSEFSDMNGGTQVAVTSAQSDVTPVQIGMCTDPTAACVATVDPVALLGTFEVGPGFTGGDRWVLAWQGALPRLDRVAGTLVAASGGAVYLAAQRDTQQVSGPLALTDPARWTVLTRIGDAAVGVHAGDVVELPGCETTVLSVLAPGDATLGVAVPGGAVQLEVATATPAGCVTALSTATTTPVAFATVRAAGLVLASDRLGYVGRPVAGSPFALRWSDESTLDFGSEALAVARKARRTFYPSDSPCAPPIAAAQAPGCYAVPTVQDPLSTGAVLRFRPAFLPANSGNPPRGAALVFTTQSGLTFTSRVPASGGSVPQRAIAYDPSGLPGHENDPTRFYVPFLDDQVLMFSPSQGAGDATTIR